MSEDKNCSNCGKYQNICKGVYNIPAFKCDKWEEKNVRIVSPCDTCTHAIRRVVEEKESDATQEWNDCELAVRNESCSYEEQVEE